MFSFQCQMTAGDQQGHNDACVEIIGMWGGKSKCQK